MLVLPRTLLACRILQYLAACTGGVAKQAEIARAISAPVPYTGKIARELLLAGFLKSVRGSQGGFALARSAACIRVGDVAKFIDDTRMWRARADLESGSMADVMNEARHEFFKVLNERSIADFCTRLGRHDEEKKRRSDASTPMTTLGHALS